MTHSAPIASHPMNRRTFLRATLAGAMGWLLAGCVGQIGGPASAGLSGVSPLMWPLARRDRWATARSPLKGALQQPQILLREFLGSEIEQLLSAGADGSASYAARPLLADLDGNGSLEIVVGDRVYGLRPSPCTCGILFQLWRAPAEANGQRVNLMAAWDLDLDGQMEVVGWVPGASQAGQLVVYDAAGQLRWQAPLAANSAPSVTVGRFQGKPTFDLYAATTGASLSGRVVLSGRDGRILWEQTDVESARPGSAGQAAVTDLDGDGADDLVLLSGAVLEFLQGDTGQPIASEAAAAAGTSLGLSLLLADLDGDEQVEGVVFNTEDGVGLADLSGQILWQMAAEISPQLSMAQSAGGFTVADVNGDGRLEVVGYRAGHDLYCLEAGSGRSQWTLDLAAGPPGDLVACDIDGDGREEVLFGAASGELFAVRTGADGEAQVLFAMELSGPAGPPTIGDINGDGLAEIALVTADGYLTVLGAG